MSSSPAVPAADPIAGTVDPVWRRLRQEAETVMRDEPRLASFLFASVLNHATLESAVAHRVASRLGHPALTADLIAQSFGEAVADDPTIGQAFRADIGAVIDRDPAAGRAIEPVLYFKGFHAIQAHRLSHWLWTRGRRDLALYLQSRSSTTPPASSSARRR